MQLLASLFIPEKSHTISGILPSRLCFFKGLFVNAPFFYDLSRIRAHTKADNFTKALALPAFWEHHPYLMGLHFLTSLHGACCNVVTRHSNLFIGGEMLSPLLGLLSVIGLLDSLSTFLTCYMLLTYPELHSYYLVHIILPLTSVN
jgi:hypothetical protein